MGRVEGLSCFQKNKKHDEAVLFFAKMEEMKKQGYQFNEHTSVDGGHGRVETCRAVMTSDIDWFEDKENWKGLKSIGIIVILDQEPKSHNRYLHVLRGPISDEGLDSVQGNLIALSRQIAKYHPIN